jgi:hypothetical protein
VTRTASHRQSSGGLTEREIEMLYGALISEAETAFTEDVSFLADVATSGLSDES